MRTLIISDIHHHWATAQRFIDTVPHDKCILLGDYFDDFGDTPKDSEATALWLRDKILPNPDIIPLIGNHDQYYLYPKSYDYVKGSGYSPEKFDIIRQILHKEHWDRFKYYHIHEGFVFSHAGLTVHLWKQFLQNEIEDSIPNPITLEYFDKIFGQYLEKNINCVYLNAPAPLLLPGWDRGGMVRYGGPVWCDYRSFAPIKGINQIFGHTPQRIPSILTQNKFGSINTFSARDYTNRRDSILKNSTSINFCLDTHNQHYVIIENGQVEIYEAQLGVSFTELLKYAIPENPLSNLT